MKIKYAALLLLPFVLLTTGVRAQADENELPIFDLSLDLNSKSRVELGLLFPNFDFDAIGDSLRELALDDLAGFEAILAAIKLIEGKVPSRGGIAVPEPSTYGIIGASVLIGMIGMRRFRNKLFTS